jgi:hypothetical protein
MKVHQLIKVLQSMPQEAEVLHVYDGSPHDIEHVWLSRNGDVITSFCSEPVYSLNDRPANSSDERFWHTPRTPQRVE